MEVPTERQQIDAHYSTEEERNEIDAECVTAFDVARTLSLAVAGFFSARPSESLSNSGPEIESDVEASTPGFIVPAPGLVNGGVHTPPPATPSPIRSTVVAETEKATSKRHNTPYKLWLASLPLVHRHKLYLNHALVENWIVEREGIDADFKCRMALARQKGKIGPLRMLWACLSEAEKKPFISAGIVASSKPSESTSKVNRKIKRGSESENAVHDATETDSHERVVPRSGTTSKRVKKEPGTVSLPPLLSVKAETNSLPESVHTVPSITANTITTPLSLDAHLPSLARSFDSMPARFPVDMSVPQPEVPTLAFNTMQNHFDFFAANLNLSHTLLNPSPFFDAFGGGTMPFQFPPQSAAPQTMPANSYMFQQPFFSNNSFLLHPTHSLSPPLFNPYSVDASLAAQLLTPDNPVLFQGAPSSMMTMSTMTMPTMPTGLSLSPPDMSSLFSGMASALAPPPATTVTAAAATRVPALSTCAPTGSATNAGPRGASKWGHLQKEYRNASEDQERRDLVEQGSMLELLGAGFRGVQEVPLGN